MTTHDYPILEFDAAREAIIEPAKLIAPLANMPEHCVLCWSSDLASQLH